jgi:general stress protein YciG
MTDKIGQYLNHTDEPVVGSSASPRKKGKLKRGFACLSPERRREIASLGGKAAHRKGTGHEFTITEASEAGKKGGKRVVKKYGKKHMAAIGKKGGVVNAATKHRWDSAEASEAGKKGGKVSGSRRRKSASK